MMETQEHVRDPYRRCEERCRHDLGRGLSVSELLGDEPAPTEPVEFAVAPFAPARRLEPAPIVV